MEIGSFIDLELANTGEYYIGSDVAKLNAARFGIFHACELLGVHRIYLPFYQCPTVSNYLNMMNVEVIKYHINENFEPQIKYIDDNAAILIVNYFGILSGDFISAIKDNYKNIIIDNCPAFYAQPLTNCLNIYSPRKFFGVPDGCYVIGEGVDGRHFKYKQDKSSDTAGFLLKRIENGCNKVYNERMENEKRIDDSDLMQMSKLTQALLSSIDYKSIALRRKQNFLYAHELYKSINIINPMMFYDESCVPMVYPLVIENLSLVQDLANIQIYTGRWWKSVLTEVEPESFEAYLSQFMIPLPIDQRYGEKELDYIYIKITELIKNNN